MPSAFGPTQTQYLCYTVGVEDLLLNAVALEFVMDTDELIYDCLAPVRAKRIVDNLVGFTIPIKSWKGLDMREVCGLVAAAHHAPHTEPSSIPPNRNPQPQPATSG